MIGTLTTSSGVISVRLPPPISTRSASKLNSITAAYPAVNPTVRTPDTLYEILRVERTATPTEIKTAYRRLAKVYHPDASDFKQHGVGDRDFIEIHNAYETLSDPASRAVYDLKWSRRKSAAVGQRLGFYTCRRWETDQCW